MDSNNDDDDKDEDNYRFNGASIERCNHVSVLGYWSIASSSKSYFNLDPLDDSVLI
jgi:hypothetical protein